MAQATVTSSSTTTPDTQENYTFAFSMVTLLFFMFGFITCLNDILVPHLKGMFTLSYTEAALIQFCFFAAYFIVSLPAGKIVTRFGYKQGTMIGLGLTACGCLLFYPAAGVASYPLFLFGLFVLASGITIIQVAVNPYISVLGPRKTASARLNLSQAFNSLGTTLAPLIGTALILSGATDGASAVQGPYLGLAGALVVLTVVLGPMHLPAVTPEAAIHATHASGAKKSAWDYRHLVLGAVGIFCYVGAEVAIGSYLVNFLGLAEVMGMPEAQAGKYVAYYWGGAMVGRFIGAAVLRMFKPGSVLAVNSLIALVLVIAGMSASGATAMWALLAVGLFNSIMFPTIFTLAIDGLGEHTAQGSGILCMAIVGGAVVPLIQGVLADGLGLQHSFFLPILCYLFIAFYGVKGHEAK